MYDVILYSLHRSHKEVPSDTSLHTKITFVEILFRITSHPKYCAFRIIFIIKKELNILMFSTLRLFCNMIYADLTKNMPFSTVFQTHVFSNSFLKDFPVIIWI